LPQKRASDAVPVSPAQRQAANADRTQVSGLKMLLNSRRFRCDMQGMHRMLMMVLWAMMALFAPGCAASRAPAMLDHSAWERQRGGIAVLSDDPRVSPARAAEALARIAPARCPLNLRIAVFQNDAPAAHCFKDGAFYVSTGLLERFSDEELAAVLAHEFGHLVIDGILAPEPSALSGALRGPLALAAGDVELHADLVARTLLNTRDISPAALTRALGKVAAASPGAIFYAALVRRVAVLADLDRQLPAE
jgi:hypothetical protein